MKIAPPFSPVQVRRLTNRMVSIQHRGPTKCALDMHVITETHLELKVNQDEDSIFHGLLHARYEFDCVGRLWPPGCPVQDPVVLCVAELTVDPWRGDLRHYVDFAELPNDLPKTKYFLRAEKAGQNNWRFKASSDDRAREIANRYLWLHGEAPLEWLVNHVPGSAPRLVDANRWHRMFQ